MIASFDIVGDVAIIKIPAELEEKRFEIARALLKALPSVKVVLRQETPVRGEYRLRALEWLAGEERTKTVHKEHECLLEVDLVKVYFSPRLSYERSRIAKLVKDPEVVVNMFAGVGCFSILIAKRNPQTIVYSIDLNPDAVKLMERNVLINGLVGRVVPIEGDAKLVIEGKLAGVADRVLMPLPEKAYEYLDSAILALKEGGWIHYYDFVHSRRDEDPVEKVSRKVASRLDELGVSYGVDFGRVVRGVGPNWYQVVLDIRVRGKVRQYP